MAMEVPQVRESKADRDTDLQEGMRDRVVVATQVSQVPAKPRPGTTQMPMNRQADICTETQ